MHWTVPDAEWIVLLTVGIPAPNFDCTAVVDGEFVELDWSQLHQNRIPVVLFDSVEINISARGDFAARSDALGRIDRLQAKPAIVCRDHAFEIRTWADRVTVEGATGNSLFPIIVDTDHWISPMYDMVSTEGKTVTWYPWFAGQTMRVIFAGVASDTLRARSMRSPTRLARFCQ